MSGGHFNYYQNKIDEIEEEIQRIITDNGTGKKDDYGYDLDYDFSDKTIEKFKEAVITLKKAAVMARRVDWLVCGDDGEEEFHKRWNEELKEVGGFKIT